MTVSIFHACLPPFDSHRKPLTLYINRQRRRQGEDGNLAWHSRARVYLELEDSTGSLSGTMIGDIAEKFLQYTGQQLMDSGSQVLEKIRITLEEEQFFYVKGMKKNVLDNEYKYDIIFLNESVPSMSTSSTSTRSRTNKGKDIAYTTDTPMPLQGQTFPSAVKQLNFPSSPGSKSKKRKIEEHPISSENEVTPEKIAYTKNREKYTTFERERHPLKTNNIIVCIATFFHYFE
ncbi:replication protein A 70 kDa DNA-binding subunit D-like [Forsythia ovata]|uniref:Replication protein A 70 kDa DNA-binding subunit D-like n=1 Tax=Forsythia ovata TaxID=205694 RepID=A0ABD1RZ25_9LAMI